MRLSSECRVYWTRNEKDTKTHIEVGNYTACGVEIPYYDGVDRSALKCKLNTKAKKVCQMQKRWSSMGIS